MDTVELLIKDVRVVSPENPEVVEADIAVRDGRVVRVAPGLDAEAARAVVDGRGRLAFPGVVDGHQHWGIYNPLAEDAVSESKASAQGGVTSAITYMRTGQYYLNRSGPYAEFMPEVLDRCAGRAYVDYAFHLAPMMRQHIEELPLLARDFGVTSFKVFMFYGGFGLHGASADQREFLMIPEDESYDIAHFEFVMRGIEQLRRAAPEIADITSLSLHCETAEIMRAYTRLVQERGDLEGLEAYSAARPPHSEGLAITIAAYLAHAAALPNINLLHLSSAEAMDSAMRMARAFPHIDFRREVTIGHLLTNFHRAGIGGKVNPPLRSPEDVEALWEHLAEGNVDWVVSDHACCREEQKFGSDRTDVFAAKSGFGGTEYLLPGLVSAARSRGIGMHRVAALTSLNPARRYGLRTKGLLEPGYDADIALVDTGASTVVRAEDSLSTQEYTPFEGLEIGARVTDTFVRGQHVLREGVVVGEPQGRYLRRGPGEPVR